MRSYLLLFFAVLAAILSFGDVCAAAECTIPALNRYVRHGDVILADYLTTIKCSGNNSVIGDLKSVVGKSAVVDLMPNKPLMYYQVKEPELIKRNDIVNVKYNKQGISIIMKLVAMESGVMGKNVKLKNVNSGKSIIGKVVAKGEAIIE